MTDPADVTDMLLLRQGEGQAIDQQTFMWDGSWPPPAELWYVEGLESGDHAVVDPTMLTPGKRIEVLTFPTFHVTAYRLNTCSQVDQPARRDEHWFRGAEYLPGDDPYASLASESQERVD